MSPDRSPLTCVKATPAGIGDPEARRESPSSVSGETMKRLVTITLLTTALVLSACAETGTYPLGEGQCKPTDPVQDLDAADCTVPGS